MQPKYIIILLGCILQSLLFAQSIDFDQFTMDAYHASPLDVTEDGETFVFTATGGDAGFEFESMSGFPGELYMGSDGGWGTVKITIEHKDGYVFDFSSIDLFVSIADADNWIIRGYNSNAEVAGSPVTFSLVQNDPYQTVNINLTQVDKITLEENPVNPVGFRIWADKFVVANILPVELVSFEGYNSEEGVLLQWETATETNNYGFQVQRTKDKEQIEWEDIGFVQGHGTTNSPKYYQFTDYELPNYNEVSYRLKQIDNDGTYSYSKTVTVDLTNITSVDDEEIPTVYSLSQNYPNPFNPATTIKFGLPEAGLVDLRIYNILGEEVVRLVNKELNVGYHEVTFGNTNLSSGMYIYRISVEDKFNSVKKMILVK